MGRAVADRVAAQEKFPQQTPRRMQQTKTPAEPPAPAEPESTPAADNDDAQAPARPREYGGPTGPEPTRYGDWERKGRCIDF